MTDAPCIHWLLSKRKHWGKCRLGMFGGYPSLGTCLGACEKRVAPGKGDPLPEKEFDVDEERRLLQAGGCCDPPVNP